MKAEINTELLDALDVGDAKSALLPDGTKLGKAAKVAGAPRAVVDDQSALLDWVRSNHPTEIAEEVRGSYLALLLNSAKKYGEAVDPRTGAIVPGITVRNGQDYITFRPEKGMEQVVVSRWRELTEQALALPGGES